MIRMLGNPSTFPLVPITLWAGDRQCIYQIKQMSSVMIGTFSSMNLVSFSFILSWHMIYYRCLGPPTFFCHPALFTIPFLMGHDNQQQRDHLGDLGPVHRQWCSEHRLLKAESTTSLLSHFFFILDLFILSSSWSCHVLLSCHQAYAPISAWLTHPLSLVIMLTLICYFCLPL